jgi:hypothetical protein
LGSGSQRPGRVRRGYRKARAGDNDGPAKESTRGGREATGRRLLLPPRRRDRPYTRLQSRESLERVKPHLGSGAHRLRRTVLPRPLLGFSRLSRRTLVPQRPARRTGAVDWPPVPAPRPARQQSDVRPGRGLRRSARSLIAICGVARRVVGLTVLLSMRSTRGGAARGRPSMAGSLCLGLVVDDDVAAHGRKARTPDEDRTVARWAGEVAVLVDGLSADRVAVVGDAEDTPVGEVRRRCGVGRRKAQGPRGSL